MHERSEAAGLVHLAVRCIRRETPKAFNVCLDDMQIVWLPKSQVIDADSYAAGDRDTTITVTEWIAREKGFIE